MPYRLATPKCIKNSSSFAEREKSSLRILTPTGFSDTPKHHVKRMLDSHPHPLSWYPLRFLLAVFPLCMVEIMGVEPMSTMLPFVNRLRPSRRLLQPPHLQRHNMRKSGKSHFWMEFSTIGGNRLPVLFLQPKKEGISILWPQALPDIPGMLFWAAKLGCECEVVFSVYV